MQEQGHYCLGNRSCSKHLALQPLRPVPSVCRQSLLQRATRARCRLRCVKVSLYKSAKHGGQPFAREVDDQHRYRSAATQQTTRKAENGATPNSTVSTSNLFGMLFQASAEQIATQFQNGIHQFQQTADKASKGFRPRPPGFPPGMSWLPFAPCSGHQASNACAKTYIASKLDRYQPLHTFGCHPDDSNLA